MSDFSITDIRIDGKRYYAVGKGHDDRVSFYTTNIAAARFWIRSEENDPTLVRPFQDPPAVASVAKNQPIRVQIPKVLRMSLQMLQK